MLINLNEKHDFHKLLEKHDKLVACFHGEWCGTHTNIAPCKGIVLKIEEMATKCEFVTFVTIDVDLHAQLADEHDINSVPCFIFYHQGKEISKHIGSNQLKLFQKIEALEKSD